MSETTSNTVTGRNRARYEWHTNVRINREPSKTEQPTTVISHRFLSSGSPSLLLALTNPSCFTQSVNRSVRQGPMAGSICQAACRDWPTFPPNETQTKDTIMTKSIGVIGIGIMGKGMALNLKKAGYEVYAYNRTKSKLAPSSIWDPPLRYPNGRRDKNDNTFNLCKRYT